MEGRLGRAICSLTVGLGIVLLSFSPAPAWHSCRCDGTKSDNEFKGGNGQPLFWRSSQRLEHAAPGTGRPEYRCYERSVQNASSDAVTNVLWEAAYFLKALIPSRATACDSLGVQDFVKQQTGPIVYGPSGVPRYETQVWAPNRGWLAGTKAWLCCSAPGEGRIYGEVPLTFANVKDPKLQLANSMSFFPSTIQPASTVLLNSEVEVVGPKVFKYTYRITNQSDRPVQVGWPIPTNVTEVRDVQNDYLWAVKKSLIVPSNRTLIFEISSSDPPKWGIGSVTIRDSSGQLVSRSIASAYGPVSSDTVELETP
jgi:hypothetical protein